MRRGAFRIISACAVYKYIAFSEVFEHLAVYFLYICLIKHVALIGFGITARHGRMIWGESGKPGYGLFDRALGAAYINGLFEAVEKEKK